MIVELLRMVARFVPAMAVCAVPVALVYLDAVVLGQQCDETGVVEIAQSVLLLVTVACTAAMAVRRRDLRGGLALVAAFFLDMFIREQDQILEMFLPHGIWVAPCAAVTIAAFAYAYRTRETIMPAFRHLCSSRTFPSLALGLFTVLAFARLFGGKFIWKSVAATGDFRLVKHVVEEGSELFGYAILTLWAISYLVESERKSK